MDCKTAEKLVQSYISGNLEGDELKEFISHVKSCKSCHDELETYFTIDATLNLLENDSAGGSYNIRALLDKNLAEKERELKKEARQKVLSIALVPVIILLAVFFYLIVFKQDLLLSVFFGRG